MFFLSSDFVFIVLMFFYIVCMYISIGIFMKSGRRFDLLVRRVISRDLCQSCGTCAGVCPVDAICINSRGEPELVGDCISCGKCLKYCPVIEFSVKHFNDMIFGNGAESNYFLGVYDSIYLSESVDSSVLSKASGGGVVTEMLCSALEKGLIDGAVVTVFDEKNPLASKSIIAKTKEQILSAAGSKYVVSHVNCVLGQLDKNETYAFVGLPCHVHALRKLQGDGLFLNVKYVVGLFCAQALTSDFFEFILRHFKLAKEDVKSVSFRAKRRGGSASGGLLITTRRGKKYYIDKIKYQFLSYLFTNKGCLFCVDHTNEFADVSIGDMWLSGFQREKYLPSIVVVRSKSGRELFGCADNLKSADLSKDDVLRCQKSLIIKKKFFNMLHVEMLRKKRAGVLVSGVRPLGQKYKVSKYNFVFQSFCVIGLLRKFKERLFFLLLFISSKKFVIRLYSMLPLKILRVLVSQFARFYERNNVVVEEKRLRS